MYLNVPWCHCNTLQQQIATSSSQIRGPELLAQVNLSIDPRHNSLTANSMSQFSSWTPDWNILNLSWPWHFRRHIFCGYVLHISSLSSFGELFPWGYVNCLSLQFPWCWLLWWSEGVGLEHVSTILNVAGFDGFCARKRSEQLARFEKFKKLPSISFHHRPRVFEEENCHKSEGRKLIPVLIFSFPFVLMAMIAGSSHSRERIRLPVALPKMKGSQDFGRAWHLIYGLQRYWYV